MIMLGADMHKGSHTIAGIAATTGEMLGDKTVGVGVGGFDQALQWARGLGRDRCGRWRTAATFQARLNGS
jgi:hypothetical protein